MINKLINRVIIALLNHEQFKSVMLKWLYHVLVEISLQELHPDKSYILVLPSSISDTDVRSAFQAFNSKTNLVIITADNVGLIAFE